MVLSIVVGVPSANFRILFSVMIVISLVVGTKPFVITESNRNLELMESMKKPRINTDGSVEILRELQVRRIV